MRLLIGAVFVFSSFNYCHVNKKKGKDRKWYLHWKIVSRWRCIPNSNGLFKK